MNKLIVLFGVLFCTSAVLASNYFETGRPILSLFHSGGFVSLDSISNQLPEVKIWEDGTVIYTKYDEFGKRKVFVAQSVLSQTEITELTEQIKASGFMLFEKDYTGENAPTDLSSTCIKFWDTPDEFKQVCDYWHGAPEYFHSLTARMQAFSTSLAVTTKARPFYPVAGFVKSWTMTCNNCEKKPYNGPKLSHEGTWINDPAALAKLWDAANNREVLSDCSNKYFLVTVQVEDLSVTDPGKPIAKPTPLKTSSTFIARLVWTGFSGLCMLLGTILLIRIIVRRKQMKREAEEAELQMLEAPPAPATSTSVYEQQSAPQYVATQWTGTPAVINTNPQYMVYYMQPTHTQQ